MIAAIVTVDGSTLRDNLITSHQLDFMSSALIPAEAVENYQEHITSCSNKAGSITSLVCNSLRKEIVIMSEFSILLKFWV